MPIEIRDNGVHFLHNNREIGQGVSIATGSDGVTSVGLRCIIRDEGTGESHTVTLNRNNMVSYLSTAGMHVSNSMTDTRICAIMNAVLERNGSTVWVRSMPSSQEIEMQPMSGGESIYSEQIRDIAQTNRELDAICNRAFQSLEATPRRIISSEDRARISQLEEFVDNLATWLSSQPKNAETRGIRNQINNLQRQLAQISTLREWSIDLEHLLHADVDETTFANWLDVDENRLTDINYVRELRATVADELDNVQDFALNWINEHRDVLGNQYNTMLSRYNSYRDLLVTTNNELIRYQIENIVRENPQLLQQLEAASALPSIPEVPNAPEYPEPVSPSVISEIPEAPVAPEYPELVSSVMREAREARDRLRPILPQPARVTPPSSATQALGERLVQRLHERAASLAGTTEATPSAPLLPLTGARHIPRLIHIPHRPPIGQ